MFDSPKLELKDLEALRRFDTPTICNAIEMVTPDRTGLGFNIRPLVCAHPALPPIVGFARTAMMRAASPSADSPEARRDLRFGYVDYIADGPAPAIMVVQDIDPVPGLGAWWGEV